jgi:hypothetical protein
VDSRARASGRSELAATDSAGCWRFLLVNASVQNACHSWRRRRTIEVSDFVTVFRESGIRSWFDWEMLQSPDYSIAEMFSRSRSALGAMETVWYTYPDGSPGDWRNQDNRRLRVEEAAPRDNFPSRESFDYIESLASSMRNNSASPYLVLPCYRTEQGKFLILDGNHRAVATYKSEADIRRLVFAITGPDNPLILPDLLHETNPDATAEVWMHRCIEIEEKFTKKP